MRIFAFSDLHGDREAMEDALKLSREYDLALFAGDMEDAEIAKRLSMEKNLWAVPGNMDSRKEAKLLERNLHGRMVRVGNLSIFGIGGLRNQRKEKIEFFPSGRSLLLTHIPPHGVQTDLARIGWHIGSRNIKNLVERMKPLICIHGHVHEGRGTDRIGETLILNPGPAFERRYAIIEIGEEINIELKKF